MKFGLLYNIDYHEEVHGSPSQYYGQILDQVVAAEDLGYHSVWFGEHHYEKYSFGAPPVMAMAAASRTKSIRIGTGVALLPLHHPVLLAEEYALLDQLSGGRLEWGVGRGFLKYGYDLLGIDPDESVQRYRETLEIVIKAWTSKGPFSHDGPFFTLVDYESFPPPKQQPTPPIFATGAGTPSSYVYAGELGVNLATAFFSPNRDLVRDGIRAYRAALQAQGIDPKDRQVLSVMQMFCADDEAQARDGWRYTSNYLKFFSGIDARRPASTHQTGAGGAGLSRMGELTFDFFDEQHLCLIGTPDKLVAKLRWIDDFYGQPDVLLLEVAQGGMPPQMVIPTLELFAREVIPAW